MRVASVLVSAATLAMAWCMVWPALAQTATDPVACLADSKAPADRLIESCGALIDNTATADVDRVFALVTRARAFDGKGQTDRAMVDLDRAIKLDAGSAPAFRLRGDLLRRAGGDLDRAVADFNEAIRLNPNDAAAFGQRGIVFNNQRRYDRAIEDYNEAIRLDPNFAQAFSDRGAAYYFKGDYQAAIRDYGQAIQLDPNRPRTFTNRGAAYRKIGRNDLALLDNSEAIRLDPTVPEYFDNRGLAYAGSSDYDKAIADYSEAIRLRPAANFLTNRGDSYQFRGDFDRALVDYDAALRLDPKFLLAYNNRAVVWRKRGDRVKALADYEAALRIDPRFENAVAGRKSLALEIERVGAHMPLQPPATNTAITKAVPSFDCATAKRAVEKVICADPRLSQLDREINETYAGMIKAAAGGNRRAAETLRDQQREFVATRNASFGKPDYDVRDVLEKQLARLRATKASAN
ncbi:tetratricopeptide repeat protein [Bradyrhizobium prioriisuperbiae]|uniref:tetratricopeptide repeat protein n=1 Tax=Bradyrhizobium prioriisuperbiae TaxID=2854389 RepID=UPI0028EB8F79|nr:tetratricopeptide repeat protein [Bradyrhizobium prioritasuperba]